MHTKQKKTSLTLKRLGSSIIGVVLIFALFLLLTFLSDVFLRQYRADFTDDNRYSLNDASKNIIDQLNAPVDFYLFYSEEMLKGSTLASYAENIIILLEEYERYSGGNIRLNVVYPEAFSEDEDRAELMGVPSISGDLNNKMYFGLAISDARDYHASIPFLDPQRQSLLAYDIGKLLYDANRTTRPSIALYDTLGIGGGYINEPYVIYQYLEELYAIETIQAGRFNALQNTPADLLILIQPDDLSDQDSYYLEQYLLSGGKVLMLLDPITERLITEAVPTNILRFFEQWGIYYHPFEVVADPALALSVYNAESGDTMRHLGYLGIVSPFFNTDMPVSSGLQALNMSSAGAIRALDTALHPAYFTPLIVSSPVAYRVPAGDYDTLIQRTLEQQNSFSLADDADTQVLAARITQPATALFIPAKTAPTHINHSNEIDLTVITDTNFLRDNIWLTTQELNGQLLLRPIAQNADFFLNAVDFYTGSEDLISLRTSSPLVRPFTKINELQSEAEKALQVEAQNLQQELSQLEEQLQVLKREKERSHRLQLETEEQALFEQTQAQITQSRAALRDINYQLNDEIEALGSLLAFINTLLIPLVILFTLLVITLVRYIIMRRRQRALQTQLHAKDTKQAIS